MCFVVCEVIKLWLICVFILNVREECVEEMKRVVVFALKCVIVK